MGYLPSEDGRILMSDGAGVVEAVGAGVQEFRVGACGVLLLSRLAAGRCTARRICAYAGGWH